MKIININERVKAVRNALNLTQIEFGKKVGIVQGHLTSIESGKKSVTEKTIKVVCATFNVNEEWLRTGNGGMFVEGDSDIINQVAKEYGLDGVDKQILEAYLKFPEARRVIAKNFLVSLAESVQKGTKSLAEFMASDNDAVRVFSTAISENNAESQMVEVPRSTIEKLETAKDVDEI